MKEFKFLKRFGDWGSIILSLALVGSIGLNVRQWQNNKANLPGIMVEGVIDGDTIVLEGKVKLRLRNVDAPELEHCGGKEAKELMESLVMDKKVVVKDQIIGQMGRVMAVIYVDGEMVNEKILEAGWGRYHSDTNPQKDQLKEAYNQARDQSLGIWSEQCRQKENLDNPECNIKGNIDDNAKGRKLYYYPSCPQYNFTIVELDMGEEWFCSKQEAEAAGYTKPKNCP